MRQQYCSHFGNWAGENLVCAGDETNPGDYPPGLFSAKEEEWFNKHCLVPSYDPDIIYNGQYYEYGEEGEEESKLVTLYDLPKMPGTRVFEKVVIWSKSRRVLARCLLLSELVTRRNPAQSMYSAIQDKAKEIYMDEWSFLPEGQTWILRNLTTKELVTSHGIALDPKLIKGPFIFGIGFGEVVMMRTCWSSNPVGMSYGGNFHRGAWAGHRFDITTRRQHDQSTQGKEEEWRDVSKEVATEIMAIWDSEYGLKWRKTGIDLRLDW